MEDRVYTIRLRARWVHLSLIVAVTAALVAPATVWASHQFTDVPDSNIFHNDISAIAEAGVTLGCNPPANTNYCPGDNVTREQMAAFMNRLGALGPGKVPVVNAATAQFAGTVFEAVNDDFVELTGGDSASANSVATLDLDPGRYMIFATMGANTAGTTSARVVCHLEAGTESNSAVATIGSAAAAAAQQSLNAALTVFVQEVTPATLECWREGLSGGNPFISSTRIIAYRVNEILTTDVDS